MQVSGSRFPPCARVDIHPVYAIEATVHAPTWEGVYGEIFKVLKPGGVVRHDFHFAPIAILMFSAVSLAFTNGA